MKPIFARHGIPEEMPYNSREFQQFAKDKVFKVTTISPIYAQSNGMSEKAVQIVEKMIVKKSDSALHSSSRVQKHPCKRYELYTDSVKPGFY